MLAECSYPCTLTGEAAPMSDRVEDGISCASVAYPAPHTAPVVFISVRPTGGGRGFRGCDP